MKICQASPPIVKSWAADRNVVDRPSPKYRLGLPVFHKPGRMVNTKTAGLKATIRRRNSWEDMWESY